MCLLFFFGREWFVFGGEVVVDLLLAVVCFGFLRRDGYPLDYEICSHGSILSRGFGIELAVANVLLSRVFGCLS